MIRFRNIKIMLAGMVILPMAFSTVACSPIYADDPDAAPIEQFRSEIDIEALKARISTAIENGELTQDQVNRGITILKEEFKGPDRNLDFFYESIKAGIAAAVESGEITQEEADAKLAGLEERKEKGKKRPLKGHHHKKPMMDIEDIKARISAAVESGEITQEEALDRFKREPKKITY